MSYPFRWTEVEVRGLVDSGNSLVNSIKSQLDPAIQGSILQKANTIVADDLDRIGADDVQRQYLTDRKEKFQAIFDAIVAQGF